MTGDLRSLHCDDRVLLSRLEPTSAVSSASPPCFSKSSTRPALSLATALPLRLGKSSRCCDTRRCACWSAALSCCSHLELPVSPRVSSWSRLQLHSSAARTARPAQLFPACFSQASLRVWGTNRSSLRTGPYRALPVALSALDLKLRWPCSGRGWLDTSVCTPRTADPSSWSSSTRRGSWPVSRWARWGPWRFWRDLRSPQIALPSR